MRKECKWWTLVLGIERINFIIQGLHCELFDYRLHNFTKGLLGNCGLQSLCTFNLPQGPYKGLQKYIDTTDHTSNHVLAEQAECPESLTQHEFYAFATLRAGHRLQWRNIARLLTDRVLNFAHNEIGQLIAQSIWQAGPSSSDSIYRESHVDLEEEQFGMSVLMTLNLCLSSVESNWQGAATVRTFTALAARLLSVSPYTSVRQMCFKFLDRTRLITIKWTREITEMIHRCKTEATARQLTTKCLEMALTCHATFDVDSDDIATILGEQSNVAIVIECAIMIHDRSPVIMADLSSCLKVLHRRSLRVAHRIEPILRACLSLDARGIECTIRGIWSGYEGGGAWTPLFSPCERWMATTTVSEHILSRPWHISWLHVMLIILFGDNCWQFLA